MKLPFKFTILLFFLFVFEIKAQQLVIRIDEPFITNSLAGIVTDKNGDAIPGVSVNNYDFDWKNKITSTSTDEKGKFKFSKLPEGLYFLKLTHSGFQEMEIKVRIAKKSKKKLVIEMEVAT
jgi:hypothetical protein